MRRGKSRSQPAARILYSGTFGAILILQSNSVMRHTTRQLEEQAKELAPETDICMKCCARNRPCICGRFYAANNVKRVIEKLWNFIIYHGQKISEHNETGVETNLPYNFAYFVLNDERAKLYERSDKRVDAMIATETW